jgi:hypothetical protein
MGFERHGPDISQGSKFEHEAGRFLVVGHLDSFIVLIPELSS